MNNLSRRTGRTFQELREKIQDKIKVFEINSKNKYIRGLCPGINEFKRDHEPRTVLVKEENGDLYADFDDILNKWENYTYNSACSFIWV
jgi:hypothetical protein